MFFIAPIILLFVVVFLCVGVGLILAGVRGRALWSSPYCMACKYDLRGRVPEESPNCPECGADLTDPKAVGFLKHGRRPKMIWAGIVIIVAPFALSLILSLAIPFFLRSPRSIGPHNLSQQNTATLLTYVQGHIDEPWGWDELSDRIKAGTLSAAEAEQALGYAITHMTTTKPNGWDQPLHWQDEFLATGYQAGYFSEAAVLDFMDAYHGKAATLDRLPRVQPGEKTLHFRIRYGSNWPMSQHGGLPVDLLWTIDTIEIDGETAKFDIQSIDLDLAYGNIHLPDLAPGEYTITVTLDTACIEAQHLVGFNRQNASADDWPQAIRRGPVTIQQTLTILSETDEPVTLSTDPALDPGAGGILVKHLVVQPERGKRRVSVELDVHGSYAGAVSFDVVMELAGERHDLGPFFFIKSGKGRTYSGTDRSFLVDVLDPDVTTADIILTPNPRHVFSRSEIDAVWGETVMLKDVPVKRFDLRDGGE